MTTQIIAVSAISFQQWLPLWQAYLTFYNSSLSLEQAQLSWQRITNPIQTDMFGYAKPSMIRWWVLFI